jgi:quercetin dioxygenase-like cupin family protein
MKPETIRFRRAHAAMVLICLEVGDVMAQHREPKKAGYVES